MQSYKDWKKSPNDPFLFPSFPCEFAIMQTPSPSIHSSAPAPLPFFWSLSLLVFCRNAGLDVFFFVGGDIPRAPRGKMTSVCAHCLVSPSSRLRCRDGYWGPFSSSRSRCFGSELLRLLTAAAPVQIEGARTQCASPTFL